MKTKHQKVALITGGNRGLGLQTAKELVRQDIHVILGARDPIKGASVAEGLRAEGYSVDSVQLDVADLSTHDSALAFIESRYGKLDILVNNAGVWKEAPPRQGVASDPTSTLPMEVLRETFETNFFGTVSLTQRLLPLVRKSVSGRIVNVSSIQGSL